MNTKLLQALMNAIDRELAMEISWVIGEAIQFAYSCGHMDGLKHAYSPNQEVIERVYDCLRYGEERELLEILITPRKGDDQMTESEYRAICNALMCNHHERLLAEATLRNDTNAISQEIAILAKIKSNI